MDERVQDGASQPRRRARFRAAAGACVTAATVGCLAVGIPAASAADGPYAISKTITAGNGVSGVAVDTSTHTAYATNSSDNTVSVIHDGAITQTIPVGSNPEAVAVDSSTGTAYVANTNDSTVSVIHGGSVSQTVSVSGGPLAVAADPSSHTVYTANSYDDSVSVIRNGAVTSTIPVGQDPNAVAVDSSNGTVYVANAQSNSVSVIQNGAVTSTIPVGNLPTSVAVDPGTHTAYVANADDGTLSVIQGGAVTQTIPVGNFPFGVGVTVDTASDTVFVANDGGNNVSVVQGGSVIETIPFTASPQEVAVDSSTATPTVYVTASDNTVSILTEPQQQQQTTNTRLSSSDGSAIVGEPVTFTATVSAPGGSQTPTGSVTFQDGSATLGTAKLDGSGTASYTTSSLAAGSHRITAVYSGDSADATSTSQPLAETVKPDTPSGLVALTSAYVQGSPRFHALPPFMQRVVKELSDVGGAYLDQITPRLSARQTSALVAAYDRNVDALARQGYLTADQAATLKAIAATL